MSSGKVAQNTGRGAMEVFVLLSRNRLEVRARGYMGEVKGEF
jgi:hypothetical protein